MEDSSKSIIMTFPASKEVENQYLFEIFTIQSNLVLASQKLMSYYMMINNPHITESVKEELMERAKYFKYAIDTFLK